jgi:DNA-binding transcriptional LysR family regulator
MELNHLKYFFMVAKEGSFTKASRQLRIQQPTVSKMVRSLEEQLGVSLMERTKTGIRLTKSGGEIYRICESIFEHVDEIQSRSSHEKAEFSGPLAFGATDSVASYLIPSILGEFLRDHAKVIPSIFSGSSNLICNEIREGKIEFGIFFTVPDQEDFQVTPLAEIPFHLVIATSHLNRKDTKKSFIISRDIDYPKSRPFPVLEMLRKNQVQVETAIACNNLDAQKELVKQGLGVALLPDFMVKSGLEKGVFTAYQPRKNFSYSLKLVTRKGKILSKNAAVFLEVFRSDMGRLFHSE